jgi:hypothetical protein
MTHPDRFSRRTLLIAGSAAVLSGCAQGPRVYDLQMSRDDGCICCADWAKSIEKTGRFKVSMFDAGDLPSFKRSVGVPVGMGACHTAKVEGYVIEGHVPAADILRLIEERPEGVLGLVVPGMPRGSEGMEQANGQKDDFTVWAFRAGGEKLEYHTYATAAS